jgi:hypothetical protein
LLASINTSDPERMAEMLNQALERWETLSAEERQAPDLDSPDVERARGERLYPKGGLTLRVNSRDLPRESHGPEWTANAWNQDYAWFTKEEAAQFLPENPAPGQRYFVPEPLVRRIARFHLVDNVRGQTRPYEEEDVARAQLIAEVEAVEGSRVTLRLEGETRTLAEGTWAIQGYRDMGSPSHQRRGMETRLLGSAVFDREQGRFVAFEMMALGTRWGATQYNVRYEDRDPAPIGFVFSLTGDRPAERVAPAFLRAYGWE